MSLKWNLSEWRVLLSSRIQLRGLFMEWGKSWLEPELQWCQESWKKWGGKGGEEGIQEWLQQTVEFKLGEERGSVSGDRER